MTSWWDLQIQRAEELSARANGAKDLVRFYAHLLRAQKEIYDSLRRRKEWLPSGDLKQDLSMLVEVLPIILKTVVDHGSETLAAEAHRLSQSDAATTDVLLSYWLSRADNQFFGKACLQPYLKWVVETGTTPIGRKISSKEYHCPFCGGNPQVSYLQNKEITADSGNRALVCATCLSSWEFRRVVCASCGEERPAKLGYFSAPEFDHVRIESCETCKRYLKGIDLTRAGFATPLVDDIDSASLDLWAHEQGYTKGELNLVGI